MTIVIPLEVKNARLEMLGDTFDKLQERYRKEQQKIGKQGSQSGFETCLDRLWERYAQDAEDVRRWLMQDENNRIDRHKIIALTQRNILEVQPLVFTEDTATEDDTYRLNVNYAHLFGLHFIARWNELYYPAPFHTKAFFFPLIHTEEGRTFQQEHLKLLMSHSRETIPLFWASQLWFSLEQWGLTHMRATCVDVPGRFTA